MARLRKTILEEKESYLKKTIKAQMAYCDIGSLTQLAPRLNMTKNQICDRMRGRKHFDYPELALLTEVLHFTDEQKLKII